MKNIVLIGIMGTGKTTVSKMLAKKLNRPVIDMDDYLQQKYQQTIPEMFDISEDYFRDHETTCCKDMSKLDGYIISTGGGVVKRKQNITYLKENGFIIYLDRPLQNIILDVETANRPLLKDGPEALYELYKQRHPLYLNASDLHIINDGSLEKVVDTIIHQLKQNNI